MSTFRFATDEYDLSFGVYFQGQDGKVSPLQGQGYLASDGTPLSQPVMPLTRLALMKMKLVRLQRDSIFMKNPFPQTLLLTLTLSSKALVPSPLTRESSGLDPSPAGGDRAALDAGGLALRAHLRGHHRA